MPRSEHEPDHVLASREVYDHSAEHYLEAVGSMVSPEFEAPIDVAVLTAFAQERSFGTSSPAVRCWLVDAPPSPERSLAGVVYWYSIIATPPQEMDAVWAELDRVLSSSGRILVAFQAGQNDLIETPDAYGSAATLELYRHRVDDVVHSLDQAGFDVLVEVRRKAALKHETTPQAMLVAHRRQG